MTEKINIVETVRWLNESHGVIKCHIEDGVVVSCVIVHNRQEVTVFSIKKGMGDILIGEADRIAFDLGFTSLWAKIKDDNKKSKNLFLRNGYTHEDGMVYRKNIHYHGQYGLSEKSREFPRMIVLSFVFACNAKCPNCPYNNSAIRETYKDARWMPSEIFKRIADEAGPHGAILRLTGGGEPFLHREIDELTAYATDRGCKVSIITNGSKSVIGVLNIADMIEFSVDAGTKEEYSKVRPGLDWNLLNSNITAALENRKKTRLICSIINQQGVDLERAKNNWKIMDVVQVRKFLNWGIIADSNAAKQAEHLPIERNIPCPWLFERISIDSRGDVTYCAEDIGFKHKFDNIMKKSISDIWRGKEYESIRQKHLDGLGGDGDVCKNCTDRKYRSWDFSYFKMRNYADSHQST